METLLLSRDDVAACLSMEAVIASVEEGYKAFALGQVQQPGIVSMEIPAHKGETDIKSCYNPANETISIKVASGFFDNLEKLGIPNLIGVITLLNGKTGAPLCIMDGSLITGIRTGAAGAISSKLLARKNARTVAMFGGGGQARMQVYALCAAMGIDTVQVYSQYPAELPQYKTEVEREAGVHVVICDSPEKAMSGADIAISTTPAASWFIGAGLVTPGTHIVAVGADMPGKNEWDPEIFRGAKVVNDSTAQCLARGETRNAILAGTLREEDIHAEIGQLLLGQRPGRENAQEVTIFDTTGMGVQDNVTAAMVYQAAKQKGLGSTFAFL